MRRGTTPAIVLTVDYDLTDWTVYATIENHGQELTLTNDRITMDYDGESTTLEMALSQEETLAFGTGSCEVQVRAIHDGTAIATDIQHIDVGRILKEGVIDE